MITFTFTSNFPINRCYGVDQLIFNGNPHSVLSQNQILPSIRFTIADLLLSQLYYIVRSIFEPHSR